MFLEDSTDIVCRLRAFVVKRSYSYIRGRLNPHVEFSCSANLFKFKDAAFGYRTHGAAYNSKSDFEFFKNDQKLKRDVDGVVNNLIEMMGQDVQGKIRDRLIGVCE